MNATDVKIFVPAKDFELSLSFYKAMGWQMNWVSDDGLAELELADCRFYLQNHYNKAWANNFMIYVVVDDAQAWYDHALAVIATGEYGELRIRPPKEEPFGALVAHLIDPSGVLLHLAQPIAAD